MEVTVIIPEGAIRQPDEELGLNEQGLRTWRVSFKGDYDTLRTKSLGYRQGQTFEDGSLRSFTLSRISGGYGMLTLALTPPEPASEDGSGGSGTGGDNPVKDIWSVHAVRNDVSIMAYCSSGLNGPQRADVEAWQKEPDGELAKDYKYTGTDGKVVTIDNGKTKEIIDKIKAGKDSVIRFYPVITRKRTYADIPPAVLENLAFIDTPSVPNTTTGPDTPNVIKAPGGLSAAVSKYNWLKIDDSADELPNGQWVRTEAWMGVLTTERSWDPNFYGAGDDRWPMPRDTQGESSQGGGSSEGGGSK